MAELKPKKVVRRRVMKAANSPEPMGPVGGSTPEESTDPRCGHDGCGTNCAVRYVGPTSHVRDHHILHAARGITHIWSAAVITGLAIVVTGAIALSSAQAQTVDASTNESSLVKEVRSLNNRIDRLEAAIKGMNDKCQTQAKECQATSLDAVNNGSDAGLIDPTSAEVDE